MAQLIPARSSCLHRLTAGKKRASERLERKLHDDYLLWTFEILSTARAFAETAAPAIDFTERLLMPGDFDSEFTERPPIPISRQNSGNEQLPSSVQEKEASRRRCEATGLC